MTTRAPVHPGFTRQQDARAANESARSVLLIVMPWACLGSSAIGVSLLKQTLLESRLDADIIFANITMARQAGPERYEELSRRGTLYSLEMLFTPHLFDLTLSEFVQQKLPSYYQRLAVKVKRRQLIGQRHFRSQTEVDEFVKLCTSVTMTDIPALLDELMRTTPWERYDIVGFSLLFDQTVASLCLAERVKRQFPEKVIVFGGPVCCGEIGLELLRSFQCVDVVAQGEADQIIVPLVSAIRDSIPLCTVHGIAFRENGVVHQTTPPDPIGDLDELPKPFYDDYLSQLDGLGWPMPRLQIETSRGCWWGEAQPCAFCGRSVGPMGFRAKSANRVVEETLHYESRHDIRAFSATDNIIAPQYFRDLLPKLTRLNEERSAEKQFRFWYYVRTSLSKADLSLLRRAGVTVGPGIETFSDRLLRLMNKGTTALRQIQFLKWATELGVRVDYGILHSIPGEREEDYEELLDLVPYIQHLSPPFHIKAMDLIRYSPFLIESAAHGIFNIRPSEEMRDTYPRPDIDVQRLCFRFEYDHESFGDVRLETARRRALQAVCRWRESYRPDTLTYTVLEPAETRQGGAPSYASVEIQDRRGTRPVVERLTGLAAMLMRECDPVRAFDYLVVQAKEWTSSDIRMTLARLVESRWMCRDGEGHYLSLPIAAGFQRQIANPLITATTASLNSGDGLADGSLPGGAGAPGSGSDGQGGVGAAAPAGVQGRCSR